MATYSNPGSGSVKPAKRTGNTGNPEKRKTFTEAKSGAERGELASMIQRAVGDRAMPPKVNPKLEGLHSNTKVGTQNKRGVKN
jgi:hypothetical protein